MAEIRLDRAILERVDGDDHRISGPDLPESRTFETSRDDARSRAVDGLGEARRRRIADGETIPQPSPVATGIHLRPGMAVAVATGSGRSPSLGSDDPRWTRTKTCRARTTTDDNTAR